MRVLFISLNVMLIFIELCLNNKEPTPKSKKEMNGHRHAKSSTLRIY